MAKFYGEIGYGISQEIRPGVWEDVVVGRNLYGDVLRNTRRLDTGDKVNNDISVGNSISLMADAFAFEHYFNMAYVVWMGQYWIASNVEVIRPRLVVELGGIYNGPKATPSSNPSGPPVD